MRHWPDWLEHVWAKSPDKGEGQVAETLARHTWLVLERLSELIKLRPQLPDEIGVPRLWKILYWAAFLHDFGKAASGFQARLRGGERWSQRHEVYSLVFVDWLADNFSAEELTWLVATIASHHKDAPKLLGELYYQPETQDDLAESQVAQHLTEFSDETVNGLWQWLTICGEDWQTALGLKSEAMHFMTQVEAVQGVAEKGALRVYHWLRVYDKLIAKQLKKAKQPNTLTISTLTLRGYITNADHAASSHIDRQFAPMQLTPEAIFGARHITREGLHAHQLAVEEFHGSVLLTAPTGSGKTEAALLWAAAQNDNPRLFYTLPYQASMNAMKLRLDGTFGKENVALQHGRAALAHYRMVESDDANPQEINRQVALAKNEAELNYPPVRVFSPYQMLKGPYRLKGYEKLLSDYHHALFIFDEIHAYEAQRLALILETIRFLRHHFQAKFMVMSATFPQLIKTKLLEVLGEVYEVAASHTLYQQFQRHRLTLLDGDLLSNFDVLVAAVKTGQSVLVVCNRVQVAQEVYHQFSEELPHVERVLLHGRFNMRDRSRIEAQVRELASADNTTPKSFVLVATQAVEVSLDIDLDTVYSEAAPLDALVQRFGRVNRRGKKGLCEVHVFREWDRKKQDWVYDNELVDATMQILERENGQPINEQAIGTWLDEIYQGEIATEWEQKYQQAATGFRESWLKSLIPFESVTNHQEQDFYKLFDGVEVLPQELVKRREGDTRDEKFKYYEDLIHDKEYLQAQELLVSISYGQLHGIHPSRVDKCYFDKGWPVVVDLPYSSEMGLDLSQAREAAEREICIV